MPQGQCLFQRDEQGKAHNIEVGYHSRGLNSAERNYDVYDREFLALVRALKFWRHLLQGSLHGIKGLPPIMRISRSIEKAQKLSGKIARYISFPGELRFPILPPARKEETR